LFNPEVMALEAEVPSANMPFQVENFGTWDLAKDRLRMVWAVVTGSIYPNYMYNNMYKPIRKIKKRINMSEKSKIRHIYRTNLTE
jgi:hypothetical protein